MMAEMEPTLTIEPPPALIIDEATAFDIRHSPATLTSKTSANSSSGTSSDGRWKHTPALFTKMSIPPYFAHRPVPGRSMQRRAPTAVQPSVHLDTSAKGHGVSA